MSKRDEFVKIVDHTNGGSKKALIGVAAGVLTGVGAATAVIEKLQGKKSTAIQEDEPRDRKVGAFDRDAAGIDSPKDEQGVKGKLMRLSERKQWHWVGRVLQVQRRYSELYGSNVAAAVTLQVFLSIFPLLLVAAAVVGFVAQGSSTDVAQRLISSLGLTGEAATSMRDAVATATESRRASSIIGLLTLAWSALGVTSALQYAYNQAWQTGGRGVKDKAVGLGWLAGASILFVATAVATTLLRWLPAELSAVSIAIGPLISFALWMFTAKLLPNVEVAWRDLIPGAIVGVIGLELLKVAGAVWVPRAVESSSSLYGTIGVVFAVLAWMLLFGKLVMYSAIVNVLWYEAKHGVTTATIEMPKAAAAKADGVTRSGTGDTQ